MKWRLWLIPVLLLSLPAPAPAQVKGPVTFSVEVPPGKWKALRLRNVPEGALVAVQVRTSGDVLVAFVDGTEYRRYPTVQRPLFSGRVEKRIVFSVIAPAAGNYFLVFDNLSGNESRAVTVKVSAARGKPRDPTKAPLRSTGLRPA
jgi:hypothetical protein